MAEISVDVSAAGKWTAEVQAEIDATMKTLGKLHEACNDDPLETDTIMSLCKTTGEKLEETWETTKSTFESAWNALSAAAAKVAEKAGDIVEAFDNLMGAIK